ncbi:DUF934 domain-containing protein [Orrella sp. JC864]|uniref:DUF934 domain-containing protein n=1 Tax=Orrella sp. JC864 TaxID=3120298 RepID=UPI0012BC05D2
MAEGTQFAGLPRLIRNGRIEDTVSAVFEPAQDAPEGQLPPDEPGWIVPLTVWTAHEAALRQRRHPVGVLLAPDSDPRVLARDGRIDPEGLALIAVSFPVYTDGRGYSLAQTLRGPLGWRGELRAVGDVMIDTLYYQARCGFDSFALKHGHDPQEALKALATFSVVYQQAYPKPAAAPAQ